VATAARKRTLYAVKLGHANAPFERAAGRCDFAYFDGAALCVTSAAERRQVKSGRKVANVRFWEQSGHQRAAIRCLLLTQSGHKRTSTPQPFRFISAVTAAVFAARVAFSWTALVGELGATTCGIPRRF
jgi:hypothetical protein